MPPEKSKRPRSSTVNSPSSKPSAKKCATSRATSHAGTGSEPDLSEPDLTGPRHAATTDDDDSDDDEPAADNSSHNADSGKDGEDEGTHSDDPVAAVRALTAARSGRGLTASEKRARFLEKFKGMKPEDVLDSLSKTWRSDVYKHFKRPEIIGTKNGDITYRFRYKVHPLKTVDRKDYQDSTGNLTRHRLLCEPEETPQNEMITAYAAGTVYSPSRIRFLIAMWCARRHCPFTIVDDPELRSLLQMLYVKVKIPSRHVVSRDVRMIVEVSKARVIEKLTVHPGRVHLAVDGWTSPNVFSFLGITAHWIDEGKLQHIILNFIKLTKSHTGRYLAEKLAECLHEYGIEEKLLAFTVDNAYSNPVMLEELGDIIPQARGTEVMVRCFGHVLNLVVKAALSQFSRQRWRKPRAMNTRGPNNGDADPKDDGDLDVLDEVSNARGDVEEDLSDLEEDNDDEDDEAVVDKDREATDDVILEALYDDEPDFVLSQKDMKDGRVAPDKITALSNRVWHNPTIRAALAEKAGDDDLNSEVLVRAVRTRWNTVTLLLERALDMREPLEQLCDMAQFNDPPGRRPPRGSRARTSRLRRFILLDEEWDILQSLYDLLHITLPLCDLIGRADTANHNALEAYLEAPPLATIRNPLDYWTPLLKSEPDAALARMALDFLSVPATSVEVERAFSRGRLTVSRLRHSLGDESVRASTLLGSWANIPDLVPEKETVDVLRGPKKTNPAPNTTGVAVASTSAGAHKGKAVIEIESD